MAMRLHIESGWRTWWRTGHWYRVTSIQRDENAWSWRNPTVNNLYDYVRSRNHWSGPYAGGVSHLRPEIRLWLEAVVPWSAWHEERPRDSRGLEGIGFSRARDVILFKLVWG